MEGARKRILDQWEPEEFRRLVQHRVTPIAVPDRDPAANDLQSYARRVSEEVAKLVEGWDTKPTEDEYNALMVVGLNVMENAQWTPQNGLVVTRIAAMVMGSEYRAHPEGVFRYRSGFFEKREEVDDEMMLKFERALGVASIFFRNLMDNNIQRSMPLVFAHLKEYATTSQDERIVTSRHSRKGRNDEYAAWALDALRGVQSLAPRFSGKSQLKDLVDLVGARLSKPRPEAATPTITFEDGTVQVKVEEKGFVFEQIPKSAANNCYFGVPIKMSMVPPAGTVGRLREFFCTGFAGTPDARYIDMAMEALCWGGQSIPPVQIVVTGNGGNAKSARSLLRHSTFGGHHLYVSPEAFQIPEEFRKQGCNFAAAKCLTVQECDPGKPLIEDLRKKMVSGEKLACRPLFGKATAYFAWMFCAKYWEMNKAFPSIKGDPNRLDLLQAFLRRIIVIELQASFSSDPSKIDPNKRIFKEDPDLTAFLESPVTALAYLQHFLFPFMETHTPDQCRAMLTNPPPTIAQATRAVVAQMANRGVEAPGSVLTSSEAEIRVNNAELLVREVHATMGTDLLLKTYSVCKLKCVPGVYHKGGRSKSRLENLEDASRTWPHLLCLDEDAKAFRRLNIDAPRFDECMAKFGLDQFGGGWSKWLPVWECRGVVADMQADLAQGDAMAEGDVTADELVEWINVVKLQEALDEGLLHDEASRSARAVLQRFVRGERKGDFAVVNVRYYRKHGIEGRRYAQGPSAQMWLKSQAKRAAFYTEPMQSNGADMVFIDIDIDNCFVTLLVNIMTDIFGNLTAEKFGVLTAFAANYRVWRACLAEYLGITEKAAKKMLIRLVHLAVPQSDIPFLWNLSVEMRQAVDALLDDGRFVHLQTMFGDRRCPTASHLHFALAKIEDDILAEVVEALQTQTSFTPNTYMFDGAIGRLNEQDIPLAKEILTGVGNRNRVSFTVKQF